MYRIKDAMVAARNLKLIRNKWSLKDILMSISKSGGADLDGYICLSDNFLYKLWESEDDNAAIVNFNVNLFHEILLLKCVAYLG